MSSLALVRAWSGLTLWKRPHVPLLFGAGAYIQPEPAATPGYASDIIFANGTFIEGSTAELSADGPLREPFVVYCQVRIIRPRGAMSSKFFAFVRCSSVQHSGVSAATPALCAQSRCDDSNATFHPRCTDAAAIPSALHPPTHPQPTQGGTHWTHWAIALESAVDALRKLPSDAEEQQAAEEEAKRKAAAAAAAGSRR